jgi:hypothetical protein
VRAATRPKFPVVDLQPVRAAASAALPSLLIEDAPAVDLIHAVHQQSERNGLLAMRGYRQQSFSIEGTVTEIVARI